MKILAIYRHYAPDTAPYAHILREILEHLAVQGHEVSVITAQPSYNDSRHSRRPDREVLGGVVVRRIGLLPERKRHTIIRAFNTIYFLLRAVFYAVIGPRYDLVIGSSHPPVAMGCALRAIKKLRRAPYIYHCQDLHPEAAKLVGDLQDGKLFKLLSRLDLSTCRQAERVVVLSQNMESTLVERGVQKNQMCIVNNPPIASQSEHCAKLPSPLDGQHDITRFLFAGNLGRFQGLEKLVAAARLAAGHLPFQLIFMGEGSAKRELIAASGDLVGRRILFLPHQPLETVHAAMRACDYGLVSLIPGVYRYAYPSKSITYWSAACPVLALIESQSELAQTIAHEGFGYSVETNNISRIADALATAVEQRSSWTAERRNHIERRSEELFGTQRMLNAWDLLIDDVGRPKNRVQHSVQTISVPRATQRKAA